MNQMSEFYQEDQNALCYECGEIVPLKQTTRKPVGIKGEFRHICYKCLEEIKD